MTRWAGIPSYPWPENLLRRLRLAENGCVEFTGAKKADGYGKVWRPGGPQLAHRLMYELMVGPIPEGLEIDHLCRNRACVNPGHLDTVTHAENHRRRRGIPVGPRRDREAA